ncbi:site-2 protease family protein [Candidatus Pacearchaeota archaeon]|nr:site-2 protease family protein [Candidatus Pacearchaeota archaeon]
MVSFWVYDVGFMILFSVFVAWFISSRKKNLSREGIIFMYRTQFGINAINYVGDNFKKFLHGLKYIVIAVSTLLMGMMMWMLGQTLSIYIMNPEITKIIKAPPIAPLIPYFPKLFGMESLFPPFYFTYFIVALAIVAIVHEFSHGIFMRLFKIKIKTTGLVFLGPILGAFVEQGEKSFNSKKKSEQMTVLGAGVFANLVFALIFYVLYVLFFFSSFAASGYLFNSYVVHEVPINSIDTIGADVGPMTVLLGGMVAKVNLTEMKIGERDYFMGTKTKEILLKGVEIDNYNVLVFDKSPAILAQMNGAIVEADNIKIINRDGWNKFLQDKEPGDEIKLVTESENGTYEYVINLGSHPDDNSKAYLGIGNSRVEPKSFIQKILFGFMSFKDSSTYYVPTWDGDFVYFIYHLLWWVMIINLLVALFNMMPLGMLDGGRFFYLMVLSISRSEKIAEGAFKFVTYAILFIFALLMFLWFIRIIQ